MLFGFMLAGGHPLSLIHLSELFIVAGMTSCALMGSFGLSFFSFLGDGTVALFSKKPKPCPLYVEIAKAGSKYAIGSGIIACILGFINTFSAISDGPEMVSMRTSAAFVGIFYGLLFSVFFFRHLQYIFSESSDAPAQSKRKLGIFIFMAPIVAFFLIIFISKLRTSKEYADGDSEAQVLGTGKVTQSEELERIKRELHLESE